MTCSRLKLAGSEAQGSALQGLALMGFCGVFGFSVEVWGLGLRGVKRIAQDFGVRCAASPPKV